MRQHKFFFQIPGISKFFQDIFPFFPGKATEELNDFHGQIGNQSKFPGHSTSFYINKKIPWNKFIYNIVSHESDKLGCVYSQGSENQKNGWKIMISKIDVVMLQTLLLSSDRYNIQQKSENI